MTPPRRDPKPKPANPFLRVMAHKELLAHAPPRHVLEAALGLTPSKDDDRVRPREQ